MENREKGILRLNAINAAILYEGTKEWQQSELSHLKAIVCLVSLSLHDCSNVVGYFGPMKRTPAEIRLEKQ